MSKIGEAGLHELADAMVVGRNFITTAENGVRALQPALDFTANMNTGVSLATTPVRGAVSVPVPGDAASLPGSGGRQG